MSLSYANFPIYVGSANTSSIPDQEGTSLPSTSVGVLYSTAVKANRRLGKPVPVGNPRNPILFPTESGNARWGEQVKFSRPLSASISFQMLLHDELPPNETGYSFLSGQSGDFFPVQIGSGIFNKCYLQDYTVNIQPYVPVTVDVNFISLDPPIGQQISGDASPSSGAFSLDFNSDDFVYGHTCAVNNMTDVVGNVQSSITYKRSFARTPIYTLGSINATDMLLDGIETETRITSTGLENLINYSGDAIANNLTIALDNVTGDSIRFFTGIVISEGARVLDETYNMVGGDTLQTTATLSEVLL